MLNNWHDRGFTMPISNAVHADLQQEVEETYKECEELEHQVITHEHTIEHLKAEIDFLKQENKELENELITQEERFDEILGGRQGIRR
jgi:septal ring factor EnvC (AmiA/AmiB activator)